MKKSELLLVKKTQIETVLGTILAREEKRGTFAAGQAVAGEGKQAGDFSNFIEGMMADWMGQTAMKVQGGVAIIPVRGSINPDDPFSRYYGETSLADINKNLQAALADTAVKAIVLNIYSPGGYVYGVEGMAQTIYDARQTKPVYAYTDSLAASAAYWLGSAASAFYLGSESAEVGSIGVYMAHFDYSAMLEANGIKVTEIAAGEFKGIGSPYTAMSAEEKAMLQTDVNYLYTRFVNTVARNRGMAVDAVLKSANGLTFYGSDAVAKGLADAIMPLQEVISMATGTQQEQQQQQEQQAAASAKAEADAKALKEANDANAAMAAELATYKAKEAESQRSTLDAECSGHYKAAFGRDATQEEKDTYAKSDEGARKVMASTLKESADARDKLAVKAGLTREVATEGQGEQADASKSPLVLAAQRLGLAVAK